GPVLRGGCFDGRDRKRRFGGPEGGAPYIFMSMAKTMKTFLAQTVEQWRNWLAQHHDSESEVWLIFHKLDSGVASIEYKDALDEALCFGWVDSLVKRLDDRRFARKFTPRKPDSRWSDVNRERYAALKAAGRVKPAGVARAPAGRGSAPKPQKLSLPAKLPGYMEAAL